jgi:glutathione synthase
MLDHSKDTTLRFAQEALYLGIENSWCNVRSIRLEGGQIKVDTRPILNISYERKRDSFHFGRVRSVSLESFDKIHYRTDPPIDEAYLCPLQLIYSAVPNQEIINPFDVLLKKGEKFEAFYLRGLMPPSVVSSQWEVLLRFGKKERQTVLKPLNEAESRGVHLLDWTSTGAIKKNQNLIKHTTKNYRQMVILQKYLPGIEEGEKRLWFLDGKLLGYIKKYPIKNDFKVNIDAGSAIGATELLKSEQQKVKAIAKHLRENRIRLAAVDLIDGFITDFNFTSPGLIVQMEELLKVNLAKRIIEVTSYSTI